MDNFNMFLWRMMFNILFVWWWFSTLIFDSSLQHVFFFSFLDGSFQHVFVSFFSGWWCSKLFLWQWCSICIYFFLDSRWWFWIFLDAVFSHVFCGCDGFWHVFPGRWFWTCFWLFVQHDFLDDDFQHWFLLWFSTFFLDGGVQHVQHVLS